MASAASDAGMQSRMASAASDAGMSSSLEPVLQQLPHRPSACHPPSSGRGAVEPGITGVLGQVEGVFYVR